MQKKIAVITGASSGIGKSVAMHLAECSYSVILLARNEEKLKTVRAEITDKGGAASHYSVDVSDSKKVQACISNIVSTHGQIDLLFNNAGILKHGTTTLPDNNIDELLRINLNGAIYVAKYVAAQMKLQQSGYIINLSSLGGKVAASFAGIYAASKFGVCGFSEALSKEMSLFNVKVTNICPSMTATEMTAGREFQSSDMIATTDINKTIDYLLGLSANAIPLEISIHCMPFMAKATRATYEAYGLDE